jgi:dienelactone hydrolase
VHFNAGADGEIEAYAVGSGTTAVVLAHQSNGDLCQWKDYATELSTKGYRALALTMQGKDDVDVLAAVSYLRAEGTKKVILVGASRGGTAAVAAAAKSTPAVDGVVDLSGPLEFRGVSAEAAAPSLTSPALFVAGEHDGSYADATTKLHDLAKKSKARSLLIVPATSAHGVKLIERVPQAKTAVEDFIAKYGAA